MSYGIRFT